MIETPLADVARNKVLQGCNIMAIEKIIYGLTFDLLTLKLVVIFKNR